jgi:hypothetical protein
MLTFTCRIAATIATCVAASLALRPAFAQDASPTAPFLQTYCFACHANGKSEGDIDLTGFASAQSHQDAELLRKLIDVLDTREMPPREKPQPADIDLNQTLTLWRSLLRDSALGPDAYVRTPIRRMNRFQYDNAVTDLFALNCIVFPLPERTMRVHKDYFQPESGKMPDTVTVGNRQLGKSQLIEPRLGGVAPFPQDLRADHGFDNRGDHLSLSPLLMEEFLKLGESITQSPDFGPKRVGIWDSFFAPPADTTDIDRTVRERLLPFLTKAFRGPVEPESLDRYASFVSRSIGSGTDFTSAMKGAAAAAISSPRFLYLYDRSEGDTTANDENAQAVKPRPIDDRELAQRLSFILWGSLPDETLLELASTGQLGQPEVLERQIDRMLRDKKLKRFCDSFPAQWLQLDRIVSSLPDPEKYPDFYYLKYLASMHMMLEPLLLFETVLIEDLPITQLIDPDFTYRSAKLDAAYGELASNKLGPPNNEVTILTFRRIPIEDRRVGGVITNAAVMTMTSGSLRTKPITRGAWVASVIFNDPPKPPPANVPPLDETAHPETESLTLRQMLAAHRERADCRGCHEQIDPLGFALENFDPVGRWRDAYGHGAAVDPSGSLFYQHPFADVVEFKAAILKNKDRFCRALAAHLLSFALARPLGPADRLAIDRIAESVAADNYKMKTLIRQIILSEPFRTKS